jgi:hypothetical protein
MRETWARAKVGKRVATASVRYIVPIGEDEIGNMGLEGYDDEFDERTFPNAGLARHWAEKRLRAHGDYAGEATVKVIRYDADEYETDTYGLILDAEEVTETYQSGYLKRDGTVHWDDPERERSW